MNKQDKPSSPAPVHRLVGPHLRLRWEKSDRADCDWLCHYELVIPFDEHDIRREVYDKNGEFVAEKFCNVISMGSTTRRKSSEPPCNGNIFDAPFRDYAHAKWDAMKLGNLPIYVIAPDGRAFLRPNAKITGPDEPAQEKQK
jgi:hypothetical protein